MGRTYLALHGKFQINKFKIYEKYNVFSDNSNFDWNDYLQYSGCLSILKDSRKNINERFLQWYPTMVDGILL